VTVVSGDRAGCSNVRPVELELDPPQPEPVAQAIAAALAAQRPEPADPWWRAGVEENLAEENLVEENLRGE
jgi:hypothetical protein